MLPASRVDGLKRQLRAVRVLFEADRAHGVAGVWLPDALEVKSPCMGQTWAWHWVFPSPLPSRDPRAQVVRRHRLHPESIQKAVRLAAKRA